MLNNIKSYTRKVRFLLICLEVNLIFAYLCTRFQKNKGSDNQRIPLRLMPEKTTFREETTV
jgi:hypothetical protein